MYVSRKTVTVKQSTFFKTLADATSGKVRRADKLTRGTRYEYIESPARGQSSKTTERRAEMTAHSVPGTQDGY